MHDSRLTFRITPWRPWLLAVVPLALVAALVVAINVAAGNYTVASAILIGFAALAALLLLVIGLAVRANRWHVDPRGIGGRNNVLAYRRLDWSEIESVKPWSIPGYPYLQVNGGGKRNVFWLPLFLSDMPGFRAAVAQFAPADNPLQRFLETH